MIKELIHDPVFLALKAEPAAKDDLQIGADLLETLMAHRDSCVGMAANMIGHTKRIIAIDNDGEYMVMYNPVILKKKAVTKQRKAVFHCWAAPGKLCATNQ